MTTIHYEPRKNSDDYERMTGDDERTHMEAILLSMGQDEMLDYLLGVGNVYSDVREELNNAILDRWAEAYDDRHGEPLDTREVCHHADCGRPAVNEVVGVGLYCDEHYDGPTVGPGADDDEYSDVEVAQRDCHGPNTLEMLCCRQCDQELGTAHLAWCTIGQEAARERDAADASERRMADRQATAETATFRLANP